MTGRPPNMKKLMEQAAQLQQQMQAQQAQLAEQEYSGSAGGGVVTAVVRGSGEVVSVAIDPSVLDPDDPELVGDLVVAAINQAMAEMTQAAAGALGSVGGMDLGDLGLDLGGLLG